VSSAQRHRAERLKRSQLKLAKNAISKNCSAVTLVILTQNQWPSICDREPDFWDEGASVAECEPISRAPVQ
jgi:hypothetical protein